MTIDWAGLSGLYVGLLCGGFGAWFGQYLAKKKRGIDERYEEVTKRSRQFSWWVTLLTMIVLMTLLGLGFSLSTMAALAIVYAVHLGSWAVATFYYNWKL